MASAYKLKKTKLILNAKRYLDRLAFFYDHLVFATLFPKRYTVGNRIKLFILI